MKEAYGKGELTEALRICQEMVQKSQGVEKTVLKFAQLLESKVRKLQNQDQGEYERIEIIYDDQ